MPGVWWLFWKSHVCMVCSWGRKMSVLGCSAGGGDDDPGWCGECCGHDCSRSDAPEGTIYNNC